MNPSNVRESYFIAVWAVTFPPTFAHVFGVDTYSVLSRSEVNGSTRWLLGFSEVDVEQATHQRRSGSWKEKALDFSNDAEAFAVIDKAVRGLASDLGGQVGVLRINGPMEKYHELFLQWDFVSRAHALRWN